MRIRILQVLWLASYGLLADCIVAFAFQQGAASVRTLSDVKRSFLLSQIGPTIALQDSFLVSFSDSLVLGGRVLRRGEDYTIDYSRALIRLKTGRNGNAGADTLWVFYRRLLLPLQTRYTHRVYVRAAADSVRPLNPVLRTRRAADRNIEEERFGANLRKSGSLVRGLSIGTNQGLKVDSGLRLQISGKISENMEVVAALTDQNLPIQPEGNTQTLQEIDKVFIQLRSPGFSATLGDYQLSFTGTEFARYHRKLQGAMARIKTGAAELKMFGAVSRGKFRTQQFLGVEGNQGPYQLTGDRGQIDIIVLAGTERVWVDGELMKRGENNDYVIEYGNGQITFTRNRLITGDSRIIVDFQYSDERFQRNLFGAEATARLAGDRLRIRTTLLREGDDKDNPIALTLTETYLQALQQAGDSLAAVDGARYVGPGKGSYIRRDSIFVYVGPDSGDYQVRFSDVGEGRGSYRFAGFGRFEYVGAGKGRYEPVIVLPRAQRNDLADMRLEYQPTEGVSLVSEVAVSAFDQNLYSGKGDGDNRGGAYLFELALAPKSWRIGGVHMGRPELRLKFRHKQNRFRDVDRINMVEYGRRWDIGLDNPGFGETVREASLNYEPWSSILFYGSLGSFAGGSRSITSRRWEIGTRWTRKNLLELDYRIESIRRNDRDSTYANTWLRQKGNLAKTFWKFRPFVELESEIKKEAPRDTLQSGFRFTEWAAGIGLVKGSRLSGEVRWSTRDDDRRFGETFFPFSRAKTMAYRMSLRNWKNLAATASYIHRERDYADPAKQDSKTDLAEIKVGYHAWQRSLQADAQYQITNTQVNRLQRVFFKVREGEGNYRYDPGLNEYVQDPFGDYILRLIPTDEFIPVVELRSRLQLRLRPEIALRRKKRLSALQKILKAFSSETLIRVEEKSRNPNVGDIYLLRLSRFQDEDFSLFGNISLRQDVYLFQNKRKFSIRYRLITSRSLSNQFLEGAQRRRRIRHEIRWNVAFSRQLANQMELIRSTEDKTFTVPGRQNRFIRGFRWQNDLSYRPERRLEIAVRWVLGVDRDLAFSPATRVTQISFKPRTVYSFRGRGRLRAELEWTRVAADPPGRVLPYELAQGNRPGNTFRWNIGFEYRISNNLNASFSYQGRDEPDRPKTLHLAKVEMRAFF